ncbi:MAG: LPS export ABC transporter periplasmic protein LptC [Spirochaetales bacterium]|nr:LPS export ABC transporter periplasmic protein LptC [Spirochaetales bacterium]MBQ2258828.1 LPS export ABC transporter periplasmic protein LptC [Spirochaetales bacterium]
MKLLAVLLSILILTSCTFSSKEDQEKGEKTAVPDIILEKAEYLLGQSGENPIIIYGDKITFYSKDNRAELDKFSFVQKADDGSIILEGSADGGLINTKTKTLNLEGNVILRKVDEGMEIISDNLIFDSENEEASADGKVMVKSKEGNFSGEDFKGDLRNMVYSFSKMEDGNINL